MEDALMITDLDLDDVLALGAIALFTAVLLLYSAVVAGVL
jgi:hypothetical protein